LILDQIKIHYYKIKADIRDQIDIDQCKTIVVLHESESATTDQELLFKMLKAVKRSVDETQIIVLSDENMGNVGSLLALDQLEQIIVFGLLPQDVGLNVKAKLYRSFQMQGKQLIFSHGLVTLNQKPEYKKPLWEALQQAFQ